MPINALTNISYKEKNEYVLIIAQKQYGKQNAVVKMAGIYGSPDK